MARLKRIHLQHDYSAMWNDAQVIREGEYDAADPVLRGRAQYLVDNGHAVPLEYTDAPIVPDDPPELPDPVPPPEPPAGTPVKPPPKGK